MLQPADIVDRLTNAGIKSFIGLPCSDLASLITSIRRCPSANYMAAANEGDAIAVACGNFLGGTLTAALMQNSGFANALEPLTSLALVYRIPMLLLVSWRGQPDKKPDEPQHEVMGRITAALVGLPGIPYSTISCQSDFERAVPQAISHFHHASQPYAMLMTRGIIEPATSTCYQTPYTAAPYRPHVCQQSGAECDPDAVIDVIRSTAGPADIIVSTNGFCSRALYTSGDDPRHFYMLGSMGCAASIGLGIAANSPRRRVIVIDGDGALLMRLGSLAMIASQNATNLVHIVLNNRTYESTGCQPTASPGARYCQFAAAAGYADVHCGADVDAVRRLLRVATTQLTFIEVATKVRERKALARPVLHPTQIAARLRAILAMTPRS